MDENSITLKRWLLVGIIFGLSANIVYTLATNISISPVVNRILFFSFGPMLIIGIIGVYKLLNEESNTISMQIGTLFAILSGVTHTIMATMQGSISAVMKTYIMNANNESQKELYSAIYRGVFSTQSGVDLAFDIFISIGVVLLAYNMWNHLRFGKIVSMLGIVVGIVGLLFNLIAFPQNAANVGLVDPGPFFGIWFFIVVIQMAIALNKLEP